MMKINKFDIQTGIYDFQLEEISTTYHAHPAIECIYSKSGNFQIDSLGIRYDHINLAIINANTPHSVNAERGDLRIVMIESTPHFLSQIIPPLNLEWNNGIYVEKNTHLENSTILQKVLSISKYDNNRFPEDERIRDCLIHLNSGSFEYKNMIKTLTTRTNLSASRLSHLFKEKTGISLKKYLVWSRLKKAFHLVITDNLNIYTAAFQSGFYDQAHLSKAFKELFGLSPSQVYNSRMIQD